MEAVEVIIPVFGNGDKWYPIAEKAIKSAYNQTVQPFRVAESVGITLYDARNCAAAFSVADWLIFLDADDELDLHYIEEMLKGVGDIRQPSTLGVYPDGSEDDYPVLIPPHPGGFLAGNHLVIGSMVRRALFERVGGFRDLPILEDWDLFIRMRLAGATVGTCPDAIYRVHVNPNSRNQQADHGQVYSEIQARYQSQWNQLSLS